ncbi:hypothetical protein HIM_09346 [Hirsutella minnesotensis 3608]|uniref:Uncharacterized protein n=1 Tax=Hirsutella minnesotensis 3608 TaxID=1043627 RepID=A0A0F7ZSF5_9HYPO|nr:hypothetical protein HIM_09346 [Hirsutella minnesotensis 3608]
MASPTQKDQAPLAAGIHIDTTITPVEKAALATVTACPSPYDRSPCPSGHTSPRSERSANPFDTDVEAMVTNSSTDKCARASIVLNRKDDCQVWPGKDHWKQRAKAAKRERSCTCLARLNRRTRIAVKILIVLLVVGIAVGVGFGVSKPLGAPIWGKNSS